MTIKDMKAWVDNASYEELLWKWRFASSGDPFFRNYTGMGDYYRSAMNKKGKTVDKVAISKRVGWKKC